MTWLMRHGKLFAHYTGAFDGSRAFADVDLQELITLEN